MKINYKRNNNYIESSNIPRFFMYKETITTNSGFSTNKILHRDLGKNSDLDARSYLPHISIYTIAK